MLLHRLAKHPEISSAAQSRLVPAKIKVSFTLKRTKLIAIHLIHTFPCI